MPSRTFLRELGARHGQEEIVHRVNICLLVNARGGDDSGDDDEEHHDDEDDEAHGLRPAGLSRSVTPAMGRPAPSGSGDGSAAAASGPSVDEVAARLAALQQRAEASEPDWAAEAAAAAAAEGRSARHSPGMAPVQEDITDAGWLPR
jgi:hypothetical protein